MSKGNFWLIWCFAHGIMDWFPAKLLSWWPPHTKCHCCRLPCCLPGCSLLCKHLPRPSRPETQRSTPPKLWAPNHWALLTRLWRSSVREQPTPPESTQELRDLHCMMDGYCQKQTFTSRGNKNSPMEVGKKAAMEYRTAFPSPQWLKHN